MKRWHRALALAIALVVINAATRMVTRSNLASGVYPSDQDAIGIPIQTTLFLSFLLSPWLLLLAVFSRLKPVLSWSSGAGMRPSLVATAIVVLYVPAGLFAIGGVTYWAEPHHYAIAEAYAVLVAVLIALGWDDFQVLRGKLTVPVAAPAPVEPVFSPIGQRAWYAIGIALFLYALPFIHNLGCIELPFGSGYDLALLYLSVPAAVVAIFGGRWIAARINVPTLRVGALAVGAGLFVWMVIFGQGYVVLANALLSPQRPIVYEAVIVEKVKSGLLRVQPVASERTLMSMEVNDYEYAKLKIGDRVAKPMVIGALQIPYIARCRWLRYSRH